MKGTRLHLDLFKVFADLALTKSFSRTAQKNFLTQSAVSQQLTFLERHFGTQLIERGKNRFALTPAGVHFLDGSRKILEAYQDVHDRMAQKEDISGQIKIETIYSIGLYHLSLYVKTFMRRFSKVNLHVEYVHADRIYTDLLQGVCDFGIVAYPWNSPLIQIIPLHKERLVLAGSPEDIQSLPKPFTWKALNQKAFVGFRREIPTRREVDGILSRKKVEVRMIQEFDNIETLKRTVEIGMGYSIVPESTISQEIHNKTLAALPLPGGPFYRPIGLLYRKDRKLSRAMNEFIHWMTHT